jgi:hypothetical protein
MKSELRIPLKASPLHKQRLAALQEVFAKACNALAPVVQKTRCWNRVALHHMVYKQLRAQFPELGSQMACNAIYSVSRASRHVYQHPESPFNVARLNGKPLPMLRFLPQSPVYFDRHTLSIKDGKISIYTLDGRVHFELAVESEHERRFREGKLREIVLKQSDGEFALTFVFAESDEPSAAHDTFGEWPEYVIANDPPQSTAAHGSAAAISP